MLTFQYKNHLDPTSFLTIFSLSLRPFLEVDKWMSLVETCLFEAEKAVLCPAAASLERGFDQR